ncbi:hypothetical protein BD779DRAFT_1560391 [Infundibulicybe gibba]|nr:hypothetical protein BD779DRAFT_1560391 [Infundibulicybe gibba]
MGQFFDEIPEFLITWIAQQKVFWVASAPLNPEGHVNLSPKGFGNLFHVVNPKRVWYEDMSGSGVETISHLRENGRITLLFNAFDGPPRICRLFGKGTVYEYGSPEYEELLPPGARQPGSRAIIMVDVYKVGTTCGFAVPYYEFKGHRTQLQETAIRKEAADSEADVNSPGERELPPMPEKGLRWYWREKNGKSLDGLPGMMTAQNSMKPFESNRDALKLKKTVTTNDNVPKPLGLLDVRIIAAFAAGILVSKAFRML